MTDRLSTVRSRSGRPSPVCGSVCAAWLALAFTACQAPVELGPRNEVLGDFERLALRQPADIAVAPVRDQTGKDSVPRELVREAFSEVLVERLYSPLASEYVDANWVEASFRGTPSPDGLLLVVIETFDPSGLYSSGRVRIGGEVVLFEGADTTGVRLWSVVLDHVVDLSPGRRGPPAPSETLIPTAVQRFARAALEKLPERSPISAHEADSLPE